MMMPVQTLLPHSSIKPTPRKSTLIPIAYSPHPVAVSSYASWPQMPRLQLAQLPRALFACFLLLSARTAGAGPLASEFVYPPFTASSYDYIDTAGAFLESRNGAFRAAVDNPGEQQDRFYLSVLHAPSGTSVWSANRDAPMGSSGRVLLSTSGFSVKDSNGTAMWSTPPLRVPVAALRLQDSGNLQLLDARNATLWQSFDNATDTLLPGQQLTAGSHLSSARSPTDFSQGDYRLSLAASDLVLTWQGSTYWRLSSDIRSFKDRNDALLSMSFNASGLFVVAADGALVFQVNLAPAEFRVLKLGYDGRLRITSYPLLNSSASLGSDFVAPGSDCELPLQCPSLGLCTGSSNSSTCTCPPLFATSVTVPGACTPRDGSVLASPDSCRSNSSGVVSYLALQSNTAYFATRFDPPTTIGANRTACRALCTANCSCLGFFHDNTSTSCYLLEGSQLGSLYWSNRATALGYMKTFRSGTRPANNGSNSPSANHYLPIILPTVAAFLLIALIVWYAWRRRSKSGKKRKGRNSAAKQVNSGGRNLQLRDAGSDADPDDDDIVIPGMPTRFSYAEIATMTASFGTKVGCGGFGSVYKGELPGGEGVVAVKKLEAVGLQAKREFCTEIAVIGNIHHVNLVRLRGFCAEGSRRLLVYEYMNRSSLDRSLFGRTGPVLEWGERMEVALGAARGLVYLHTGCNQRIVHCDVKPENILLADGGQVKISDFGLAKLMSPEHSAIFTTMRGTRGYLAPEWLSNTAISDRADVYSFGMVLLELVHGRKNRGEQGNHPSVVGCGEHSDLPSGLSSGMTSTVSGTSGDDDYFPMVALELHEQGRYLDLADSRLEGRVSEAEVARAVRVALCCLHEDPALRPSMSAVVRVLEGSVPAPEPRVGALGFLRLYGRGHALPASLTDMAGTPGSVGGATASSSQQNESSLDMSAPS